MPTAPAPVLSLVRRRKQPVVVQTLRSTVAAVLAYVAALLVTGIQQPLLAPLTGLLVVQFSLYSTLTIGFRRVISVIAGVLIAVGFSDLVGLTWWSLGVLLLGSLAFGHLLRVAPFVEEVAISAMLVLGVGHLTAGPTALNRIVETLVGALVGILVNLVFAPAAQIQPASEAIENLAARLRRLLLRIGNELRGGATLDQASGWLEAARDIDRELVWVDGALSRAEESLRLNPRARQVLHAGRIMRSSLDTLERCSISVRALARSLIQVSMGREGGRAQVYGAELAEALEDLLGHLAEAVDRYGRAVTAEISASAEGSVGELEHALAEARADRAHIAALLRSETERDPERWELHGAFLANIDLLIDELDVEKRAEALALATSHPGVLPQARGLINRARSTIVQPRNNQSWRRLWRYRGSGS